MRSWFVCISAHPAFFALFLVLFNDLVDPNVACDWVPADSLESLPSFLFAELLRHPHLHSGTFWQLDAILQHDYVVFDHSLESLHDWFSNASGRPTMALYQTWLALPQFAQVRL